MFDPYLGVPNTQQTTPVVTGDSQETTDTRPEFIKNQTDIDAATWDQFLEEMSAIEDQFAQEDNEAAGLGSAYSSDDRGMEAGRASQEAFRQRTDALLDKYGVPRTFTTDAGSIYQLNSKGEYAQTYDAGVDYLGALIKTGALTAMTGGLGSALSGVVGNTIIGNALASGITTGIGTGFDEKAMLDSMLQAGLNAGAIELLKTDAVRDALNSFGETLGLPTEFTDTDILQQGDTVLESATETTPVMGLGDTLATLLGGNEATQGSWQTYAVGSGDNISYITKPFFFDKSIEAFLDFIPESIWQTIDPTLTNVGEIIRGINNTLTNQGGAGGQGGAAGTGGFVTGSDEEEEDDEDDEEEEDQTEPDTDGDGIPDSQDTDIDGDGVPNDQDPDPFDPSIFEDTTVDSDGDGIADEDDPFPSDPLNGEGDRDGDGIKDKDDAFPDDPLNGGSGDDDEDETIPPVVTNTDDDDDDPLPPPVTNTTDPDPDPDPDDDDDDPIPPTVVDPTPVNPTLPPTSGGSGGSSGGLFSSGSGAGFDPQSFMASISYNPQLLTPFMPQNSRDYLADLLSRLQQ